MIEEIEQTRGVTGPRSDTAAVPRGEHAVPLLLLARISGALHRDTHYDWMDFHSMPGLSQEW